MSIVLERLTKRYAGHPVVNQVSLQVADGEFFVLLGPSGSGKSTILRLIAGLTTADAGRVLLDGHDVTALPPQQRGVGFVFQHYALFRHMSVADNIVFGLRIRKVRATERRRRCDALLDVVGLTGLGSRMPHQLSGGQQQRVALARALAYQPAVLLLDEPFGALDAKIRVDLRRVLRRIQREMEITTVFVTHDQEEAFALADRIGVMHVGRLLEVGPPDELYQHPQTEFVASFLGTANLFVGQATADGVQLGPLHFPLNPETRHVSDTQRVQVLFRPEDVLVAPSAAALDRRALGLGEVEQTTFAGSFERLRLRLPPLEGVRPIAPTVPFGGNYLLIEATRSQDQARQFPLQLGDRAWVGVRRIHALIHPGLSVLILSDGSPAAQAALAVGGQFAQLAHARTTILGYGAAAVDLERQLAQAKQQLGSGLPALDLRTAPDPPTGAVLREEERQPVDLVVLAAEPQGDVGLAEQLLQVGAPSLAGPQPAPRAVASARVCRRW